MKHRFVQLHLIGGRIDCKPAPEIPVALRLAVDPQLPRLELQKAVSAFAQEFLPQSSGLPTPFERMDQRAEQTAQAIRPARRRRDKLPRAGEATREALFLDVDHEGDRNTFAPIFRITLSRGEGVSAAAKVSLVLDSSRVGAARVVTILGAVLKYLANAPDPLPVPAPSPSKKPSLLSDLEQRVSSLEIRLSGPGSQAPGRATSSP